MTTEDIIDAILAREGGFVDNPADRGGPTHYGITQTTLSEWRGHAVTTADVQALTEAEARKIYQQRYVELPHFDRIRFGPLRALVVDSGVQHGTLDATEWLQRAACVRSDGDFGPITEEAVNSDDGAALYRGVLAERCRYYGRLISDNRSQAVFAAGWTARVAEFIEATP